jgi:hypothetical protein
MSFSDGYPATKPTLLLDFANTKVLDPRVTFTRASTGTYFDEFGLIKSAISGTPRFTHAPTTGKSLGLLVEEQRTNLLLRSEEFDNAAWTKTRSSVTANAIVSPDGTMNADKMVEDTGTGSHTIRNATSVTITSGDTLTASVFVKAAEGAYVIVGIGDGGGINISRNTFNLSTVAVTSSTTAAANVSAPIPVITSVGNGWYRCSVTATVTGVTTAQQWIFKGANSNGNATFTGDGTSGIYLWGAQLGVGAFATSYIPTTTAQVTRAADVAVMTGTNFSSWFNALEGTFYAETIPMTADYLANKNLFVASDNSTSNFVGVRYGSSGTQVTMTSTDAGAAQADIATGTLVAGTTYRVAGAYKLNDFKAVRNGGSVSTDTSGTVPTVTRAEIGCLAGANIGSQTLSKLAYYPLSVTSTQLQGLTL